jgi:hypothetical protein
MEIIFVDLLSSGAVKKMMLILGSGAIWLGVGIMLMAKGLPLIVHNHLETQNTGLLLISIGLLVGFIKGRWVLSKTVERIVKRIITLPQGFSYKDVYPRSYLVLLSGMIVLGLLLKWLPIPVDVRGTVDVIIGSALINGAFLYFRCAIDVRREA